MLHTRHIVVADFPNGTTRTLYQGPDAAAADRELERCVNEAKADQVLVFNHPIAARVRQPLQEAIDIARQAEESKNRQTLAAVKAAADLAQLKAERARLESAIKKIEGQAAEKA